MKILNIRFTVCSLLLLCVFVSCNIDEIVKVNDKPTITFDKEDGIYVVKIGKSITIEPTIKNDGDGAIYTWTTSDGKLISQDRKLTYTWEQNGQVYIVFKVKTDRGSADKEIRVDVAQLVTPKISLPIPEKGYIILQDQQLDFVPTIDNGKSATYEWKVGENIVANTCHFNFVSSMSGKYRLSLTVVNEDGTDFIEFDVDVKSPNDMPFSWEFETDSYNVSVGRTIRLMPYDIMNSFDAEYVWSINDVEVKRGSDCAYDFVAINEGVYKAQITMNNSSSTLTKELIINVCAEQGRYKRIITEDSKSEWSKVHKFLAAPGQFVNENYLATTMAEACDAAEKRLAKNQYISLGGFGGYIVFGFDHSIENDGGYNIQIFANSFSGSSEPGIVYVMQDENGDELPNDTWYELKGSEYGKIETIQNYEVTYYRPKAVGMSVEWRDNQGKSGSVDYLAAYHRQDYYYPAWVKESSYVLRGTCLKPNTREVSPSFWSNDSYEWGYADNFSTIDRLTNDDNFNAGTNANHFKISNAVGFDGAAANLQYVDFVKIQTGVNFKAGWLGEVSTEVIGIKDFNMIKNK